MSDPDGRNPVLAGVAAVLLSAIAVGHAALLYGALTNNLKIAELGAGIIATATSLGGVATAGTGAVSSAKSSSIKNTGSSKSSLPAKNSTASTGKTVSGNSSGSSAGNLNNVKISSFGQTIYEGSRDLSKVLNGIKSGSVKDRGIFENAEKILPQNENGYYKEYEVPDTPNYQNRGAGPERIVTGKNGEIYYTPDHYQTFIKLSK